jgi:hypothetical protein
MTISYLPNTDHHWERDAACSSADPDLFLPLDQRDGGEHNLDGADAHPRIRDALAYCSSCPVVALCRDSRSTYTDVPQVGVYGNQYITLDMARARMALARQLDGTTRLHTRSGRKRAS